MIFDVTQTLVKNRVVRVEARNANDAKRLAQEGFGKVVRGRNSRLKLLVVLDVVPVPDDTQDDGQLT